MSLLARVHSALAWLTLSHSSVRLYALVSASQTSLGMRIGSEIWSEYLRMMSLIFHADRKSSSPSRRCSVIAVPRSARSIASTVNSPSPPLSQRTASEAGTPARRVSTVTRSATMKAE